MFAVAVWDGERRRLVLARDRFGIKPLYYRDGRGELRLRVGAEGAAAAARPLARARPRRARGLPRLQRDPRAAHDLPRGAQAAARPRARAGGRRDRGSSATPSTGPRRGAELRDEPWEALAGELRERLRDSVRAHLVADVPVGVLLSGGIDSSALAALAAQRERARASRRSRSASRSARSPRSSSRARSRGATAPTTTSSSSSPTPPSCCRAIAAAFDEPFADSSALPTYLVSAARRAARQGRAVRARAATSCSAATRPTSPTSSRCAAAAPRGCWRRWPSGCRAARAACRSTTSSSASRARRTCRRSSATTAGRRSSRPTRARALLRPERRGTEDPLDVYRARWAETEGADTLARLQDVDRAIYLVDDLLVKTDRMSMAHSLELRVPFLDPARRRARARAAGRGARCAASPRSGCCARRSSRSSAARSPAGASRASRSPPRRGCGASSSRSPRGPGRRAPARARATSTPRRSTRLIDAHVAPPRGPLAAAVGADELLAVAGRAGGGR